MQRIADDFTSIRQEMERIEAERGGGKVESAAVASEQSYGLYGVTIPLHRMVEIKYAKPADCSGFKDHDGWYYWTPGGKYIGPGSAPREAHPVPPPRYAIGTVKLPDGQVYHFPDLTDVTFYPGTEDQS